MRKTMIVLALAGLMSATCLAQEKENGPGAPKSFYQLHFVVQELENERVINSRAYSMILRNGNDRGSIRAGEKVPYASSSGANTEWQQIDVGVNIDCHNLEEMGDRVGVNVQAQVSSVMEGHRENSAPEARPIIGNNLWTSTVLVPLSKPTIIYSSDDPASKRKMQLQLTVVPVR